MLSKSNKCIIAVICLVAGIIITLPSICRCEEFSPIPLIKGIESLKPGDKAPLFRVKDLEGNVFDFNEEVGKHAYLMVFWSIYCEPCREEMPLIEKVHQQYKDKGVMILSINMDGDPFQEAVKGFVNQGKYTFKVLMDELEGENFKIADPYNVAGTPVIYIVNTKGEIYFTKVGRLTEEELTAEIGGVLSSQ